MKQHRVHDGVVDGVTRRVKVCRLCGQEKVAEAGADDSGFWVHHWHKGRPVFYPRCKACYYAGRKNEEARRYGREWRRAYRQDPENAERIRGQQRAYYARVTATAEGREDINERARLAYALRVERTKGREVEHRSGTVVDGTLPRVLLEPFREWLTAYRDLRGLTRAELARELDIEERRIHAVEKRETARVALDVVDRALLNAREVVRVEGRMVLVLDDLYPLEAA